jgi:3-hydroxyacyl-[acyl-carrier-protein] dehydratase
MPEYLKLLKLSAGDIKKTAAGWAAEFVVPEDLPWFSGHFPGQPVLPAVITTEISDTLIRAALGKDPKLVANAKFKGPVLPGFQVRLTLTASADSVSVLWQDVTHEKTPDNEHFLADLKFKL